MTTILPFVPVLLLLLVPLVTLAVAAIRHVRNAREANALLLGTRVFELAAHAALAALPAGTEIAALKEEALRTLRIIGPDVLSALQTTKGLGAGAYVDAALTKALVDLGAPGTPEPVVQAARVRAARTAPLAAATLLVLGLGAGCSGPQRPTDGGTPAPAWQTGATISLTIARGAVREAEATEALIGFTGTALADYDHSLHLAGDALAAAQNTVDHGADVCALHADASLAVDAFEHVAGLLADHGQPVPSSILRGAGRLVAVLESALPPCDDAGASANGALVVRMRAAFGRAHATLPVPASAESTR